MLKVIIIDDEQWSLDYMRDIVNWEQNGAVIVGEFSSARRALEFLHNNRDIDLVFLDVEMPGMNGIEFLRNVGKSLPKTDFVFISGHDKFEYVRDAMRYRATDYLLKPIESDEVLRLLACAEAARERDVVAVARHAQVGILTADIQKNPREIWGSSDALVTACCVCEALDETVVDYLKKFFDEGAINCYRSVFHKAFFIRTDREALDRFLGSANSDLQYRFGLYVSSSEEEKLNNMLIKAQNAYDGLWFCEDAGICVFDENSEKLLLKYVIIISKYMEDGLVNEAHENIDGFLRELRSKRLQGRAVIIFANKLIEILMLRFGDAQDVGEYMLIDVNHARKRFGTPDKLVDFLHNLVFQCGLDSENMKALKAKDFVPMIKKYIEENYQNDLSLSLLAKEFMMSSKYLSSVFKKTTGMNLNRYINIVRINRAEVMLQETEISIQDISYLCGYGDCSYFTKVFREIMGETPTEYRINRTK